MRWIVTLKSYQNAAKSATVAKTSVRNVRTEQELHLIVANRICRPGQKRIARSCSRWALDHDNVLIRADVGVADGPVFQAIAQGKELKLLAGELQRRGERGAGGGEDKSCCCGEVHGKGGDCVGHIVR